MECRHEKTQKPRSERNCDRRRRRDGWRRMAFWAASQPPDGNGEDEDMTDPIRGRRMERGNMASNQRNPRRVKTCDKGGRDPQRKWIRIKGWCSAVIRIQMS